MSALDTLLSIAKHDSIMSYDFKYCLVDSSKRPFKIDGNIARPNHLEDFSSMDELASADLKVLENFAGLGVSVQASAICAIDIDHCASIPLDVASINVQTRQVIDIFKDFAYIEFSFSGKGVRMFFKAHELSDYEKTYYTKNSKEGIECYFPEGSARYVTITGNSIYDNPIRTLSDEERKAFNGFLDKHMRRPQTISSEQHLEEKDDRSIETMMKRVRLLYLTDPSFQNLWFDRAPGSGHDESERDYHLIAYLYENVTKDRLKLKQVFEESNFFKTKDWRHVQKWKKNDFRYFNYVFDRVRQNH